MQLRDGQDSVKTADNHRAKLKSLEQSVANLRQASDLEGLAVVQSKAKALAEEVEGRARRKAERIATKALEAADNLRQNGAETNEERLAREAREADQARWKNEEIKGRLLKRMISLLHLLLNDGSQPVESVSILRALPRSTAKAISGSRSPRSFSTSALLLVDGYEQSHRIFAGVEAKGFQKERPVIERTLKTVAVELMTAGAELRGLTNDSIPLIAYSLFSGKVPDPVEFGDVRDRGEGGQFAAQQSRRRVCDAGRRQACFHCSLPPCGLLGEAQAYAEKLRLTSLAFS